MLRRAEVVAALVPGGPLAGMATIGPSLGRRCGAMPALTLLPQDRIGGPVKDTRVVIAERFSDT